MKRVRFVGLLTLILSAFVSAAAEPALAIRVYERSGLPSSNVDRAMRELLTIYRSAGIEATVRNCPLSDSCPEPFNVNEVGVRLVAGTSTSDVRRLAAAFVPPGGNLSTVYVGAVIEAATRVSVNSGPVLGYVMAHEVAHLFGLSHSSAGVMRTGWTDVDYRAMGNGGMLFTRAEAKAMHSTIAGNQVPSR
jgi:hypothetical protein